MRWQMALYKEMAGKAEDADAPVKVVKRVQEVSAVLYHLEVVSEHRQIGGIDLKYSKHLNCTVWCRTPGLFKVFFFYLLWFRQSTRLNPRRWCGTNCCPSRDDELWSLALGWRRYTTYQGERDVKNCRAQHGHSTSTLDVWNVCFALHCRHRASNMFLEGYKRNWLHSEGYSFEDRMIDDLSVSVSSPCQSAFLSHYIYPSSCLCIPESNGARRRRWRGGERNKARSPPPAYSAFQSYCFNRKEVWCSHTKYVV